MTTIEPALLADSYANDPRVDTREDKAGYTVLVAPGEVYEVRHAGLFGWTLCEGPNLDFVQLPKGGVTDAHFAIGMASAGEIIAALIGPPQR